MFENRRMPNGTSEPTLGLCGVGGRACEGSLYPIPESIQGRNKTPSCCLSVFTYFFSFKNLNSGVDLN